MSSSENSKPWSAGVEGLVAAAGDLIHGSGSGEVLCFLFVAILLGFAEIGEIFVALAA